MANAKPVSLVFRAVRTIRSIFLKSISLIYDPDIGLNPVLILDWKLLARALRKKQTVIWLSLAFIYILIPVLLALIKKNIPYGKYLFAVGLSTNSDVDVWIEDALFLIPTLLFVHYLSICNLNLVNPLGKFYGDAAVEDAPVAPGYARQFITARLIPRLSILPLMLYMSYGIILGRQWAIDMALGGFLLLHLFTVFSAIIAFTHLLSFAIFVQVFVSNSSIRFVIIAAFVIISVFTYNPESLLAALKTFAGADGEIVFLPYLLIWGFSPFGTIEAVERFYLDWTSEFSRFMDPRIAIAVRACVQICVIAAIVFAARIRFRKVFPPPRA